jgi:fatty acid desaturase
MAARTGGNDMLSREDSRRLAQLERELWRADPDFCARMAGRRPPRRRVPASLIAVAAAIWVIALMLAVSGWWAAAAITSVWATVLIGALAYRSRSRRGGFS